MSLRNDGGHVGGIVGRSPVYATWAAACANIKIRIHNKQRPEILPVDRRDLKMEVSLLKFPKPPTQNCTHPPNDHQLVSFPVMGE